MKVIHTDVKHIRVNYSYSPPDLIYLILPNKAYKQKLQNLQ